MSREAGKRSTWACFHFGCASKLWKLEELSLGNQQAPPTSRDIWARISSEPPSSSLTNSPASRSSARRDSPGTSPGPAHWPADHPRRPVPRPLRTPFRAQGREWTQGEASASLAGCCQSGVLSKLPRSSATSAWRPCI